MSCRDDATLTRTRLLRAGEQRFARDGVTGARMSDVVRDAGQANDSAVGYHFGSRQGLLDAIVAKHVAAMDERREVPPRSAGLRSLVDAIVRPTADAARHRGRARLPAASPSSSPTGPGVGSGHPAAPLRGIVIGTQLEALTRRLGDRVGMALARERVALMVIFLTGAPGRAGRGRSSRAASADVPRAVRRPPRRRAHGCPHRSITA